MSGFLEKMRSKKHDFLMAGPQAKKPPKVFITQILTTLLSANSAQGVSEFVNNFGLWRELCDAGMPDGNPEDSDPRNDGAYFFARDGFYRAPLLNGVRLLRHVHLAPQVDQTALGRWDLAWAKRRKRTSKRSLVYVEDTANNAFLLIDILPEPTAHAVADMQTLKDTQQMNSYLTIANAFYYTGNIVA